MYTEIDTIVPIPTEASLVWPSLAAHKEIQFPQATIGNTSVSVLCTNCVSSLPRLALESPLTFSPSSPLFILSLLSSFTVSFLCPFLPLFYFPPSLPFSLPKQQLKLTNSFAVFYTLFLFLSISPFLFLFLFLSIFSFLFLFLFLPLNFLLALSLQTKTIKLTNPSRHPVVVQPVLLHYYPQPQRITKLLFETGLIENLNFSLSESSFSLDPDFWGYDGSLESHTLAPQAGGKGGGGGGRGGGQGEKSDTELRLKFLAHENRLANSLLLLRNNLTGLECVLLQGRGLEGRFSVDGVQPDTGTPLLFQLSSSDLEVCSGKGLEQ